MNAIRIAKDDNVATVIDCIPAGAAITFDGGSVTAAEMIPVYHKAALRDIPAGSPIIKYGEHIGFAACDIAAGSHVHTHNVESRREVLV